MSNVSPSNKVVSLLLSIVLIFSFMPSAAFADDESTPQQTNKTMYISQNQDVTGSSGVSQVDDQSVQNTERQNFSQNEGETDETGNSATSQNAEDDSAFEFIYVDYKEVELNQTQSIVVSFSDSQNANSAKLWYQKTDGELQYIDRTQAEDGAALFELKFTSSDQLGNYDLVKVSWEGDAPGEANIPAGEKAGYSFSVIESSSEEQSEDISVYSIDESGNLTEKDSVSDAIEENEVENTGVAPLSRSSEATSRSGNMVIALDPGHGGSDPGAVNGSLVEKTLNLKIATYCKNTLDQYSGVTTFMTRSTDEYVGLTERVTRAVNAGADVFISFHINSATSKATGFEVWVQNDSSWRNYLHEESSELATSILDKLSKFGLTNRGNKESDSQSGNKYADGSPADYLTVLYESRMNNVPAVLIEHGFINGTAADQALLSSESSLKEMGEADAEGIAEYYGLSKGIPDAFDPSASYQKTIEDGEYVINSRLSANKVLDVPSASKEEGKGLQLYMSNGSNAQKFIIERDSTAGYYSIKNSNSNLVLGLEKNQDGTYKTRVVQQAADGSNNAQKWIIEKNSDGTFTIKNAVNPSYAVDVANASTENGASIQVYLANGSNAQKYNFLTEPNVTGTKTIDDGLYEVANVNSGKVLDIASGSTAAGANCQQYESNGTAAQKFTIKYDGNGFYTLVNLKSGKALEVESTAPATSVNVQQGDVSSTDAQKWAIADNGDGTYKLTSKATGLVLDVASASKDNKANIDAYTDNGTAAQKFTFKSVKGEKVIAEGDYAITSKLDASKVLDITSASKDNSAKVQLYKANGTAAQSFRFTYDEETGFYTITNNNSGKVLDLPSASVSNGTRIQQYTSNNTLAQRWVITESESGVYQISSALDTTKCFDVASASTENGAKVQLYTSNGTNAQKFQLISIETPNVTGAKTIDDGLYEVANVNSGKVLDIASGSTAAGANCQQYESNGTAAQKFTIKYDGNGFYTLVNLKSGKALEVESTAPATSVNVQQGDVSSTDAQKWAIADNGDGTYKLTSKATGLVLDVASASKDNKANIDAYTDNGTAAQKFTFKSVKGEKVIAEGDYAITSKLDASKVLDITSASKDNSAKVQLYKANGTAAQSFRFTYDEETGFYTITNNNSGKVLDLPSASVSNGTRIQQYTSNNTLAQRWVITESESGVYQISSALDTTKCFDVASASTENGAKVQLYTSNGTNAQKFSIETAKDPYLIMGSSEVTATNLASHYISKVGSSSYPSLVYSSKGASSITDFCRLLIEEANMEGVRADVVYAQIMLETNYLRFGGDVKVDQCNFGGLGATGGGNPGLTFADVRTGLRVSVQHLKAYASTAPLVNECVDPRFKYVERGCAPSVYDLGNGKWASDPQYASKIISILFSL